jgi:hypothetical protein
MKTFIFWKLVNGKKVTVETITGYFTKEILRDYYKNIIDFDGIDSVI